MQIRIPTWLLTACLGLLVLGPLGGCVVDPVPTPASEKSGGDFAHQDSAAAKDSAPAAGGEDNGSQTPADGAGGANQADGQTPDTDDLDTAPDGSATGDDAQLPEEVTPGFDASDTLNQG